MKILQAMFFPPEQPGGVSSMVPYIQENFKKIGWDMEIFYLPKRIRCKGSEEIEFATFDWEKYKENEIVEKYIQTIKDYTWWTKLRLQQTYDVIHAHHPIAGLVMKKLFPDTPVIITIHSSYENELLLNHKIKASDLSHAFLTSIYRELEFHLDGIITVSKSFKAYLSKYVENEESIQVIYNGYDFDRFRPITHDNHIPQIISLCRLVPAKGLDILLSACAELKKRGHNFVLHIIGDGPIREELEQKAKEKDVYEEIIFYGYMLHPEEFIPFYDIFVLPSRAEAFGSVFAEAALSQLALVGTNIGGIAEQIDHGKNGLLVPVDDVPALTNALEELVVSPNYRVELARNAWEKAKSEYSISRVINQLKMIYQNNVQY
ncbi:glycosyltransferase family 4 protein [Chengkuizengella axinellae]|uniref:Glycosyltransferase family 4 protein n=1 Tax=Chengkuizengella axinellae TaxID=3064388 RepID=A0ABT9J0N8_9BACL|nr:glycosyltransferase family 4 protein [Chengkuizengella sp. 2205SS18-9]MDP5274574.1 glycosyltransferase family 4 protein [Chengkuizengella sp. 2205SS18-9]